LIYQTHKDSLSSFIHLNVVNYQLTCFVFVFVFAISYEL